MKDAEISEWFWYNVNDFTDQILYGIADEVCVEKYGESTGIY